MPLTMISITISVIKTSKDSFMIIDYAFVQSSSRLRQRQLLLVMTNKEKIIEVN